MRGKGESLIPLQEDQMFKKKKKKDSKLHTFNLADVILAASRSEQKFILLMNNLFYSWWRYVFEVLYKHLKLSVFNIDLAFTLISV